MILILSIEKDASTNDVIDWLVYNNIRFLRINGEDLFSNFPITIKFSKKNRLMILGKETTFSAVWYRRWFFDMNSHNIIDEIDRINSFKAVSFANNERSAMSNAIFENLTNAEYTINLKNHRVRKAESLKIAQKVGLKIPETIFTNNKLDLLNLNEDLLITKPMSETNHFIHDSSVYSLYTTLVTKSDIKNMPDFFFPTCFQKYINKEVELRVFFFFGECYSMAIFSQADEQTMVDFRNYNVSKCNRSVPFLLPKNIKKKIKRLMKILDMETGSIDVIKTIESEYYFLEVNPIGQFGMVSYPCNYFLEEKIAQALTKSTTT